MNDKKVNVIQVINGNEVPINIKIVEVKEKYGRDNVLTNEKETLVEFYDDRFKKGFTKLGQFISRYYISTFLGVENGIALDGGIENWHVTSENVTEIKDWIKRTNIK